MAKVLKPEFGKPKEQIVFACEECACQHFWVHANYLIECANCCFKYNLQNIFDDKEPSK